MKRCCTCAVEKPLEDFHRKSDMTDGRQALCKECIAQYKRDWRAKNRDHVRAVDRAYYARTVDHQRNRLRLKNHVRKARLRANGVFVVTIRDLNALMRQSCAASHLSPCDGEKQVDHIVPIARGGQHSIGNLQVLCAHHNSAKRDRLWVEYRSAVQHA